MRQLTELHGGAVRVESAGEGGGATFTVELPLMIAQRDEQLLPQRDSQLMAEDQAATTCPPIIKGARVLVVDDETDSRAIVTAVLEYCGVEVASALSASEALAKIKEWLPDVVVSDIGMPHEDGYVLINQLRALPHAQGARTPAIALTAYASLEDKERTIAADYQIHLPKPVEPAALTSAIAELIEKNGDTEKNP